MRKFLMLMLIFVLTATVFAGCRRNEPETTESTAKPTATASAAPSSSHTTAPSSSASTAPSESHGETESSHGKLRPRMPRMPKMAHS